MSSQDPVEVLVEPVPDPFGVDVDGAGARGIVTHRLRRSFGPVLAVESMDVRVPPGQVTALIGPNGSGKTTLMLMLAGLLAPDSGALRVCGADPVSRSTAVRVQVGWMPDALGSWETLTCREILTTFAAAYCIDPEPARARAAQLLADVHLSDLADAPARVLSRGQKQRLGLARALVHDPQVVLLDEPASGLDPRSRVELRALLRGLASQGKAVLVSSHVLSELDELADRAVFVSRGRTVDAQAVEALTRGSRQWLIEALDPDLLRRWLQDHHVLVVPGAVARPDAVVVELPSRESAADLLRDLVRDAVPVATLAPASGALEQAYLEMEQDRR